MLEGIQGVSTYAQDVDNAFIIVTIITLFLFIVTIGSMLYFVFRYRASKHEAHKTKNISHYTPIEIAWTVIPTILMMIVFYFGLDSLRVQRTMPNDDNAIIVKVLGQRWSWQFEYENGKKSNELYIPVNENIKLHMTAPVNDVLHSFYVPAFRAKEDLVPGQTTYLWFNATKIGRYDIQCAEYCGTRHAYMRSAVHVVSNEDFQNFIEPTKELDAIELMNQYGCTGCHSFDGTTLVGPSLKDIYNTEVTVSIDGKTKTIKRDENYLKNSILKPNEEIVEGFVPNMMPPFEGQISNEELEVIINFLKGEKKASKKKKALDGKALLQNNGCLGCHSMDGSKIVGPTFKGSFNAKQNVIQNGKTIEVIIDDEYLKRSILTPKEEVVEGYPNIMPGFEGILKEEEIDAIIQYIKTIQ